MDHKNPAQGTGCEERLLHVQKARERPGQPGDGSPSCPPDGTNAALLVHGCGSFGPLSIVGTVNKRATTKAWGVIFVCTATSLTHVELAESYSTEAFLLALRRFMALHGAPK